MNMASEDIFKENLPVTYKRLPTLGLDEKYK